MQPEDVLPRHLSSQHELPALFNWSLPWIQGLAILSLLIGLQGFCFALIKTLQHSGVSEVLLWATVRSASFAVLSLSLFRLLHKSKRFVDSEEDRMVGQLKAYLDLFWIGLLCTILATTGEILTNLAGRLFLKAPLPASSPLGLTLLILSLSLPALLLVGMFPQTQKHYRNPNFVLTLESFASRNLPRLRFFALITILGSLCSFFLWFTDRSEVLAIAVGVPLNALNLIFLAIGMLWFRKSLADVKRNPTPIIFERALNRLNVFWLIASGSFVLFLCSGFLVFF